MAKYSNINAPVTNQKVNQRIQDTQALKARAAVQQMPTGASIAQAAQQTGAGLTAQAGQQALQTQGQDASQAAAQAGQAVQKQGMVQQQEVFDQRQNMSKAQASLESKLFGISEEAANLEQQKRLAYTEGKVQQDFLNEQQLADWTLANAKDEQEYKDKLQVINKMHNRKNAMVNRAYDLKLESLKQQVATAERDQKRKYQEELRAMQQAYEDEKRRQANAAANRRAKWSAYSTIGSVVVGGAVAAIPGGAIFAPAATAGSKALFDSQNKG